MNFIDHAHIYGVIIRDLISDGRWHRVATEDKPKKRNGAYLFDGQRGVVKNWATMESFASFPKGGSKSEPVDFRKLRASRDAAERREAEQHAKAAQEAYRRLSVAVLDKHTYLSRKGFPKALGLVLEGQLLIPMRDYKSGEILSIQSIGEDKKFLSGGRAKGAVFVMGGKDLKSQRWLVEGYATGLSVKAALDAMYIQSQVWVCFSAVNLQYVAERIPGNRFVFADNDQSKTGQRVAEATGLPWVMSPVEGEDANDLHQRAGVWELINVIKSIHKG